jgi:hypothetical protein
MTDKKKTEEKRPLDMTTDEAMEFLLGEEGARKLKEGVRETYPPREEKSENASAKPPRKHSNS